MCRTHKYIVLISSLFFLHISDKAHSCLLGSYKIMDNACFRTVRCNWEYWKGFPGDIVTLEKGKCVSQCEKGTYAFNGTCEKECPVSLSIFDDSICISDCPYLTFRPRNKPRHCYFCHPECNGSGCFGKTELECNKCKHKQYHGRCVPNCPTDTFEDKGKCVDSCQAFSHDGQCVSQCPKGFYPSRDLAGTGICSPCHSQCKTCNGPNDSECFSCNNKNLEGRCVPFCQPQNPVYFNGTCYTVCPGVVDNQTCVANCPHGRKQLEHKCVTQCPDNYITIDGKCMRNCTEFILNGKCVEECPASQYILTHNKTCIVNCPSDMKNSSGCIRSCQQFLFREECLEKCPEFYFTDLENKKCVQSCPEAYPFIYNTICTDQCQGVYYNSVCYDKCPNGFPTVDTKCVRDCPMTHPYLDPQNNQCTDNCTNLIQDNVCVEKCLPAFQEKNGTCSARCPPNLFDLNETCVDKCPEKIFVTKQQCVSACPNGTFTDGVMCQQCHSECSDFGTCSGAGPDQCETCRHYKYESKCVSSCPSKDHLTDPTKKCVKKCPKDAPFLKDGNNVCMASCPSGYGEVPGQNICTNKCYLHSLLQTPENSCVYICPDEYPFSNGHSCLAKCPVGFLKSKDYSGYKTCVEKCSYEGLLQTPDNECVEECPQEYPLLFQTNCFQECPSGYLRSVDKKLCVETCSSPSEFLTPKNECVNTCPYEYPWSFDKNGTKSCRRKCPNGIFMYEQECVESCPNGTFLLFDTYCSLQSLEKCEQNFNLTENSCPDGFIDFCTGTCMTGCPTGTLVLYGTNVYGSQYLSHLKVCTKFTYTFGPLIFVISSCVYVTATEYVIKKFRKVRQKNPLRNQKIVKKLLLEDAVINDW